MVVCDRAAGIARAFGVHADVIGAITVAVGTSLPELMTVLHSRLRGHDEVGVGTLLGSKLFNGWAIVGVAAALRPITTPVLELAPDIGFDGLALLLVIPRRSRCHPAHAGCAVAGRLQAASAGATLAAAGVFILTVSHMRRNWLAPDARDSPGAAVMSVTNTLPVSCCPGQAG